MPLYSTDMHSSQAEQPTEDDIALVNESKAGGMEAFNTLVRRHEKQIFAASLSLMRNQADAYDVAQDTFITAFRKLSSFDGRSRFSTWLTRIAINLSLNQLHRTKSTVSFPQDAAGIQTEPLPPTTATTPLTLCQSKEDKECLQHALASLSDNHRAVITLRELQGLSYQEISRIMGCSIGTVMSRLAYAREALRTKLSYMFKRGEYHE